MTSDPDSDITMSFVVGLVVGIAVGLVVGSAVGRSLQRELAAKCYRLVAQAPTAADTAGVALRWPECHWYVDEAQGEHRKAEAKQ